MACTPTTELPGLGFLDAGSASADLSAGLKLELPYWVLEGLAKHLKAHLPKSYKETYREILLADANVVDLHKLGPHFYEFGLYLMKHCPEEGEAVGASLSKAFKARFLNLMDAALNCQDVDALKECAKLDEMERLLFRKAYRTRQGMGKWTSRKVYQINTSNIVASFKKRKMAHST